jgi:hypothetical protein
MLRGEKHWMICAIALGTWAVLGLCHPLIAETAVPPLRVDEHPLMPALRIAHGSYEQLSSHVRDYTCILVKRERVDGKLADYQHIFCKIRHEQKQSERIATPFSVYLRYLGPARIRDREVLYVEGENEGKLIARKGGGRFSYVTLSLDPFNESAMRGNRYPIMEIGIQNLVKRLIEVGEDEIQRDLAARECRVQFFRQAKINGRVCTCIHVMYPERRAHQRFHLLRIYVDDQLYVPIRYEAYDWPDAEGEPPRLLEEYTYLKLKLNVGLTDEDFDRARLGMLGP